jgi:hypothetical protein
MFCFTLVHNKLNIHNFLEKELKNPQNCHFLVKKRKNHHSPQKPQDPPPQAFSKTA